MTGLARAAFSAFRVSIRLRVISPWAYLNWLVFPVLFAAVGLYVLSSPGAASSHVVYGVLGGGLIGYWSVAYLEGGNGIQEERWNGTLEQIFAHYLSQSEQLTAYLRLHADGGIEYWFRDAAGWNHRRRDGRRNWGHLRNNASAVRGRAGREKNRLPKLFAGADVAFDSHPCRVFALTGQGLQHLKSA